MGGVYIKILIVYYSKEGNTKFVGEVLAEAMGADIEPLRPLTALDIGTPASEYWSGDRVERKVAVPVHPLEKDPSDYDLIVLGTPVWTWAPSPPMLGFLKEHDLKGKKVAVFVCSEGETGRSIEVLREGLKKAMIVSEKEFISPLGSDIDVERGRVERWGRNVMKEASEALSWSGQER